MVIAFSFIFIIIALIVIYKADLEVQKYKQEKVEAERLKAKEMALNESIAEKRSEIEQLNKEYVENAIDLEQMYTRKLVAAEEEHKLVEKELSLELDELEEELQQLIETKAATIEELKEKARDKDVMKFHSITFSSEDLFDIEALKEVELQIHNKDVLRKLIYKTYYENAMKELFARINIPKGPGIYKIENKVNGKVYIGQSTNVYNRLREHIKSSLGISSIAHQFVHEAMREEGIEHFMFSIVEEAPRETLNKKEKYWINFYKSNEWGYNKTQGGS